MANITLSITVDDLTNAELDNVESEFYKFFKKRAHDLPMGTVTDVTETDREEDEEESDE
jgi:hypothetical protein